MDIRQKIEAGEYKNKLPWPSGSDKEARRAKRDEYRKEEARLMSQFKTDLFLEYGLDQHPMREKVWSKAWDDGHASGGLHEVVSHFEDLLPLLESPLKGHPGLPTLIADLEISAHDASDGLDAHVTEAYKLLLEILRVKHF